jgi:DNA modification methylase
VLANPGNLIKGIKVGGGMMGHKLAHENEAPYPQKLAEWFIRSYCELGGLVLDPFSGSGTTVAAAVALGRRGIGLDLRLNQCQLGRRRCAEIQQVMF